MYPPYRVKSLLRSFTVSNLDPKSLLGTLASLGNRMKRADKKEHNLPQETKHCTKSLFSLASSGAFSCVNFHLWFINEPHLLWNGYLHWIPSKLWEFEFNLLTYPICPSPDGGGGKKLKETWIPFALRVRQSALAHKMQKYVAFFWPLKNSGDFEAEWV